MSTTQASTATADDAPAALLPSTFVTSGGDRPARHDAGHHRSVRWWFGGAAAALAATLVLVKLAVSVVPQPWDGTACMLAFLPILVPTRYLRLRAREG